MSKNLVKGLFFIVIGFLLFGCATPQPQVAAPTFEPQAVSTQGYEQWADNFLILADFSSSEISDFEGGRKFRRTKEFMNNMNQTLPDLDLTAGIRRIGLGKFSKIPSDTALIYGMKKHVKSEFAESLAPYKYPNGPTAIGTALEAAGEDLRSLEGNSVIIIVSNGASNKGSEPVVAADKLKYEFGDRLCIYTVLIGDDPAGKKTMEQLADAGGCGFFMEANEALTGAEMADFIRKAFYREEYWNDLDRDGVLNAQDKCPKTPANVEVDKDGCPLDSDGDGVPDYMDACPDTPKNVEVNELGCPSDEDNDGVPDYLDGCPGTPEGVTVNELGCWVVVIDNVYFDTNKSDIKAYYISVLNDVVEILTKKPSIQMEIQGHADERGTAEYNQTLSENRAKSVMEYLVNKGIDPSRLSYKGFGFSRPVAPNDTPSDMAKNRRVELLRSN